MTGKKTLPKHCGLEGPAIGRAVPGDWVRVELGNGRATYMAPDKAAKYKKGTAKKTTKKK